MPTQPEWVEIDDKNMIGEMWQYFQGLELSFREYIDSSKNEWWRRMGNDI